MMNNGMGGQTQSTTPGQANPMNPFQMPFMQPNFMQSQQQPQTQQPHSQQQPQTQITQGVPQRTNSVQPQQAPQQTHPGQNATLNAANNPSSLSILSNNASSQMGMQLSQSAMQLQNAQTLQQSNASNYQTQHHQHQVESVPISANATTGVSNATSSAGGGVNAQPAPSQQHDSSVMPPLWNSEVPLQNNMLSAYHYSGNQHGIGQHANPHSSQTFS